MIAMRFRNTCQIQAQFIVTPTADTHMFKALYVWLQMMLPVWNGLMYEVIVVLIEVSFAGSCTSCVKPENCDLF